MIRLVLTAATLKICEYHDLKLFSHEPSPSDRYPSSIPFHSISMAMSRKITLVADGSGFVRNIK